MFRQRGMAIILTIFALAVPLATAGYAQAPHCVSGTVATYVGTTCELDAGGTSDKVTYVFNSAADGGYTCTGTASICTSLGVNGANLAMKLDPVGPYTLNVGNTDLWNVSGNESVDVKITGTVQGIVLNENWPHFNGLLGQTGGGVEDDITTVNCSATHNCTDSLNGTSAVVCDALTTNGPNCNDYRCPILTILARISCYNQDAAGMNDVTTPYAFTIEVKLAANGGTATFYGVGTHLLPPDINPGPQQTALDVAPGSAAILAAPLRLRAVGTESGQDSLGCLQWHSLRWIRHRLGVPERKRHSQLHCVDDRVPQRNDHTDTIDRQDVSIVGRFGCRSVNPRCGARLGERRWL